MTHTAFDTVLAHLAAAGILCTVETDPQTGAETWASYHCADTAHITWGADSDTGAENSAAHAPDRHGRLTVFCATDDGDQVRAFDTGDFTRDTAELIEWMTSRIAEHGRSRDTRNGHTAR